MRKTTLYLALCLLAVSGFGLAHFQPTRTFIGAFSKSVADAFYWALDGTHPSLDVGIKAYTADGQDRIGLYSGGIPRVEVNENGLGAPNVWLTLFETEQINHIVKAGKSASQVSVWTKTIDAKDFPVGSTLRMRSLGRWIDGNPNNPQMFVFFDGLNILVSQAGINAPWHTAMGFDVDFIRYDNTTVLFQGMITYPGGYSLYYPVSKPVWGSTTIDASDGIALEIKVSVDNSGGAIATTWEETFSAEKRER